MTDRYQGFIVVLEHDLRKDDAEATIAALKQIKGVISVEPQVADITDHMARQRVRHETTQKLWEVLHPSKPV